MKKRTDDAAKRFLITSYKQKALNDNGHRPITMEEQQRIYERIINGCTLRERRAQASFYDMFAQRSYATAYRILESQEEAEEVVQEIILRTLTHPELLVHDRVSMERRLRRMVINECIDLLRKRHITWEKLDTKTDVSDEQEMDVLLIREERTDLLRQAIMTLPPQSRTVLQLSVLEEMDNEEIASILHITSSSVRAHMTRAKQKLIKYFRK